MFRSFEANSRTIQQKGLEDLAKSSASAVDLSNLGQAPKACANFCDPTAASRFQNPANSILKNRRSFLVARRWSEKGCCS